MLFVLTAQDLNPGVKEQWHTLIGPESPETPRPPLAEDEALTDASHVRDGVVTRRGRSPWTEPMWLARLIPARIRGAEGQCVRFSEMEVGHP